MIDLNGKKVLLVGSQSMTGIPTARLLREKGAQVIPIMRQICDARQYDKLFDFLKDHRPIDYCINLGGVNGSIHSNKIMPATIFGNTAQIGLTVLTLCLNFNIKKVVTPLTSCGYSPSESSLLEKDYLKGEIHESVQPHGEARRFLYRYGKFLNREFDNRFVFCVFNNLYGPYDRYNEPNRIKVAGSLVKKFCDAVYKEDSEVEIWGTGKPRRELMYSDDAAASLVHMLEHYEDYDECVNIGTGYDISICDLAEMIAAITGFKGEIVYDTSRPDGQMFKLLNITKMVTKLQFQPQYKLNEGLKKCVDYYRTLKDYHNKQLYKELYN